MSSAPSLRLFRGGPGDGGQPPPDPPRAPGSPPEDEGGFFGKTPIRLNQDRTLRPGALKLITAMTCCLPARAVFVHVTDLELVEETGLTLPYVRFLLRYLERRGLIVRHDRRCPAGVRRKIELAPSLRPRGAAAEAPPRPPRGRPDAVQPPSLDGAGARQKRAPAPSQARASTVSDGAGARLHSSLEREEEWEEREESGVVVVEEEKTPQPPAERTMEISPERQRERERSDPPAPTPLPDRAEGPAPAIESPAPSPPHAAPPSLTPPDPATEPLRAIWAVLSQPERERFEVLPEKCRLRFLDDVARLGFDRALLAEIRQAVAPRVRALPGPGDSWQEILAALGTPGGAGLLPHAANALKVVLGDRDQSWGHLHGVCEDVALGRRPAAEVIALVEVALTKAKPAHYFAAARRRNDHQEASQAAPP